MEPKVFIIENLKKLVNEFLSIRVRYEFEEDFNNHIVEIVPDTILDSERFNKAGVKFIDDFYTNFPDHNIMFISDKELLGVKKCCFTASGIFFTKDHKNPDWSNDLNNVKYSFPAMNDESVNSGNNYNYALAA